MLAFWACNGMRDGSGGKFGFDGETVLCYRNYQLVKGYAFKNGIILLSIELVIKQVFPKGEGQTLVCGDVLRRLPGKRIVYDGLLGEQQVIVKLFTHKIKARRHLKKEWLGLTTLRDRGLNGPKPLFFGRTESDQWALVTEKILNASSGHELLCTGKIDRLDLLLRICREIAEFNNIRIKEVETASGKTTFRCKVYAGRELKIPKKLLIKE